MPLCIRAEQAESWELRLLSAFSAVTTGPSPPTRGLAVPLTGRRVCRAVRSGRRLAGSCVRSSPPGSPFAAKRCDKLCAARLLHAHTAQSFWLRRLWAASLSPSRSQRRAMPLEPKQRFGCQLGADPSPFPGLGVRWSHSRISASLLPCPFLQPPAVLRLGLVIRLPSKGHSLWVLSSPHLPVPLLQ